MEGPKGVPRDRHTASLCGEDWGPGLDIQGGDEGKSNETDVAAYMVANEQIRSACRPRHYSLGLDIGIVTDGILP